MLKNYFKIAIAVLKRRKFFTFISLFGISITLTILMVITAFFDHLVGPKYPDYKRDRSLYVNIIQQRHSQTQGSNTSPASFYFLDTYVRTLKTPAKVAISSNFLPTNTYVNNKKLILPIKYTNADFWDVLEFEFKQGKPYDANQIARGEFVAVITEQTRKQYFGDDQNVVGKYIETDNVKYRVTGVVRDVPITRVNSHADIYVPYTLPKSNYKSKSFQGSYAAIILANSKSDIPKIKDEFARMVARVGTDNPKQYDQLVCYADFYLESFTRPMFGGQGNSGLGFFYTVIAILTILFMLLPTINLVNINISRIMERSSEIGVRKAFGASSGKLVVQFIVENIFLTILGGIIGIVFSLILIYLINNSGWLPHADLSMNLKVLSVSLVLCVLFGFVSGVYPAWRMSRLQVVTALKAA
jgi:putative ABC transport system permease protein